MPVTLRRQHAVIDRADGEETPQQTPDSIKETP